MKFLPMPTVAAYTLPYPPSINHYWRRVGHRTLISRRGRLYRESVGACLMSTGFKRLHGALAVEITANPPDYRRRDLDNLLKSLLDALEHAGAYDDDSQINVLVITRGIVIAGGSVVVEISRASS